ncbi:MAG: hypothetical protein JEZ10_07485 [Verrucomicrobia bacterium]|nr:hypothetical protein [Verrucomicrobiota bacterium]
MTLDRNLKRWVAALLLLGAGALFAESEPLSALPDDIDAFSMEPLRDPFWPVGYFPDDWKTSGADQNGLKAASGTDWDAPAALIRVTGTSQMGSQTVAIINGELKGPGELIRVRYNGRIYEWKLKEVQSNGKVLLDRHTVQSDTSGF